MSAYQPIENYGIIGDLSTVALVGMDGSVDFLSFPDFDSPTVFAALLDSEKGGRFQIAPVLEGARQKQIYLPDSQILLTRFLAADGVAEISDFMPIYEMGHAHDIVRRAKCVRGEIRFRVTCAPRFDYARASHRVEARPGEVLFISEGPDAMALRLRTSVPLEIRNGAAEAEFVLRANESAAFVLERAIEGEDSPSESADYISASFKQTVNFWRAWVGRSSYQGRWREAVNRSAMTLKLLTSQQHGSIVAAPTFGLPEVIGGERNWDYRYTWIRDSSFTIYALMRLGYVDEAVAFMQWIEARCAEPGGEDGPLQVMYRIAGGHDLDEEALSHLEGYRGSRPVRIGNDAHRQFQLDLYGELMDSVYLCDKYGRPISYDLWNDLVRVIDWVVAHWRRPDEGIWEARTGRHAQLYSRVMCWVAVDRALRLAEKRSLPAPFDAWRHARDAIHKDVFGSFWSEERRAFVQTKSGRTTDAASLLMPLVKFISPTDPRWLSTLTAIEHDLVDDSHVHRYLLQGDIPDGLPGQEGTFSMCTFWYVECLARAGDLEQARFIFEKMLGYANHLGLYAEELGPSGEALGNFPQAFTHVGLISAAHYLDRALSEKGQPS